MQSALENLADASTRWWIGATDKDKEGHFEWVSGATWSYTNWNSGEPNNIGDEDCVELKKPDAWNDIPCSGSYAKPLCQYTGKYFFKRELIFSKLPLVLARATNINCKQTAELNCK